MPFDKTAISRACIENNLEIINARWLDSAKIVRRTWDQFAYRGYGLANVANFLKLDFEHHDALEDAITAAKVVLCACDKNQIPIEEWFQKIYQPINGIDSGPIKIHFEGNPEGSLYGETIVFTGALSLPRFEAAKIAVNLGCRVDNSVTKSTTILVVGTQDIFRLAGYKKSSKHRKTEELKDFV
jgi:DNA polymerase-3 subunit epsilon